MKSSKILAIVFQAIQLSAIGIFLLSQLQWNLDWIKVEVVGYSVIAVVWAFANVLSFVAIAKKD